MRMMYPMFQDRIKNDLPWKGWRNFLYSHNSAHPEVHNTILVFEIDAPLKNDKGEIDVIDVYIQ